MPLELLLTAMKSGDQVIPRDSTINDIDAEVREAREITHRAYQDLRILKIDVPDSWRQIDPGRQG
jgi:hypothetical protein